MGLMLADKPDHVPEERIVDFDFYDLPLTNVVDPQTAYLDYRKCGDIFWTPRNGGHWVLTRARDIREVQTDWDHFVRSPRISIPDVERGVRALPIQSDPPEHATFRRPLTKALLPQVVERMAEKVRRTTVELIDGFADRGECDFVQEFSQLFPILIFLDLVNLPRSDREKLLPLAEAVVRGGKEPEVKRVAFRQLIDYLTPIIEERRANPGEDLISLMVNVEVDGQKIALEDAFGFVATVVVAGLDTVAAMLGFVIRHFAMHPDQRRDMAAHVDDEAFLKNAVEELLRRYAIANSARYVREDMDYKGVRFRKGDMLLVANVFVGLDEDEVERPFEVDLRRPDANRHAAFDVGPHTCAGAHLARRELRVFLEEWFQRIPDFEIKPGTTPLMVTGMVSGVLELELRWPSRG